MKRIVVKICRYRPETTFTGKFLVIQQSNNGWGRNTFLCGVTDEVAKGVEVGDDVTEQTKGFRVVTSPEISDATGQLIIHKWLVNNN